MTKVHSNSYLDSKKDNQEDVKEFGEKKLPLLVGQHSYLAREAE